MESNPYSPPNRDHAPPPTVTDSELPPDGRYQLEPADSVAAVRARLGNSGLIIVGVGVVVLGWNLVYGDDVYKLVPWIGFVVIMASMFVAGPIFASRAVERMSPAQRRVRIALANENILFADEAGNETRAAWSSFKTRRMVADRLFLELQNGVSYVVPRRAWGADEDFAQVRTFIEARVPEAKRSNFLRYAVIMWVVLIAMFVAIWSFFSDVPRR